MSPWVTKIRKDLVAQLESWVKSIGEAKLKPRQKLVLLNHYALARLNYPLTQDAYPMHILRSLGSTHCRKELGKTPRLLSYHNVLPK